jgi:hypothetical protein
LCPHYVIVRRYRVAVAFLRPGAVFLGPGCHDRW